MNTYWTSSNDELRLARVHISVLERSLKRQREKRQEAEIQKEEWKQKYDKLEKEHLTLHEELDKTKRQRDRYRSLLFKENTKGKTQTIDKEEETQREEVTTTKNRGGKKGHDPHHRPKPDHIDQSVRLFQTNCPTCDCSLSRTNSCDEHFVEDIPAVELLKVIVTLYQIERQWCTNCKKEVRAKARFLIPHSRFGINLTVYILMLRYAIGIPVGKISKLVKNTYNSELSRAGIINLLHNARDWFGDDYSQILEKIRASKVKHADETTWRIDGTIAWVWEFLTKEEVYLCIEEGRGGQIPKEKLEGSHGGDVLVRDDYRGYTKLAMKHQSCWAHHLKEARYECEQKGSSDEVRKLRETLQTIFGELKTITEKQFDKEEREKSYEDMKPKIDVIINANYQHQDTKRIQTRFKNQKYNVLTAVLYPDVPLTNNLAERILRPMVVTRKMTGGSKSQEGAKTHAVNMSIVQTILMRNQPLIPTLKEQIYSGAIVYLQACTGKG